jgi:hypothetical protein
MCANHRPGVDAGWPLLFADSRSWPRATQAERWACDGLCHYECRY